MQNDIAIEVENITKVYQLYNQPIDRLKEALHPLKKKYHKDFHALKNISLQIRRGETVGIIGKNGSGKSTLLKMITGVLTPTCGSIRTHGKVAALLELGAGFNQELTGLENIYLNGTIMGFSESEMQKRVDSIVEFADIGQFINQPVKTYSSGMSARLGFAVSIHVDPDILIIDEALSVGDAAFQRKCFAKIEDFRQLGKTILFVSHGEGNIVQLCSRAVMLSEGQKVVEGAPKTIVNLYAKYGGLKYIDAVKVQEEYRQLMASKEVVAQQNDTVQDIESGFSTELITKSAVEYPQNGALLSGAHIETTDGREVNVLMPGKRYYYCYTLELFDECDNLSLGMLLKNKQGVPISGQGFPLSNLNIGTLQKGKYRVRWRFENILNEGVYFLNCGVVQAEDGKRFYLHRILDVCMFKVLAREVTVEPIIYSGVVNIIESVDIALLEEI